MRYLIGLACLAYASYFAIGIYTQKAKVRRARAELERFGPVVEKPIDPRSMAAFGEMVTPIVQAALVFLAIKMCFAYYVVDAGRFVSLFDLAGALALLLAYGMWLSVKTSVRVPSAERDSPAQRQAAKQPALTAAVTATRDHTFLAPSVTATLNPKISSTLAAARGERLPFGLEGST